MIPLVEVQDLSVDFCIRKKTLRAVKGVSFCIRPGETLGLVGESGCGKSTIGRAILRLTHITGGRILFEGHDILSMDPIQLCAMQRSAQMVFQDPYASLNPRMTIRNIIGEPIDIHHLARGPERESQICTLLECVSLSPQVLGRFPHEFSAGQRQRISIARALAAQPRFLICDEPISSLDVSVQAQIINLLSEIQKERGLAYLFITHDLRVVKYLSDRVAVMYLGEIVETAPTESLYQHPLHPYTEALLSAIPIPDPVLERTRPRMILHDEMPSPFHPPKGCGFSNRCPKALPQCSIVRPPFREIIPGHSVACHLYETNAPPTTPSEKMCESHPYSETEFCQQSSPPFLSGV